MSSSQYAELVGKGTPTVILNKANWEEWNALMTPYLQSRGVDDLVESKTVAGVDVNPKYQEAKTKAEADVATDDDKKAFREIKKAAASVTLVLRATASANIRAKAQQFELPHQIWAAYERVCKPKTNHQWQQFAEQALHSQQFKRGESVSDFITRIDAVFRLYKEAHGSELPDSRKNGVFFGALKQAGELWSGWANVYSALNKSYLQNCDDAEANEVQTVGIVMNGISAGSSTSAAPAAMAAAALQTPSQFKRRCFFCDEEGHTKRNCPVLKKKKEKAKEENKQKESTCGNCDKPGHTTEKCWSKKKKPKSGKEESSDKDDDPFAGLMGMVFSVGDPFVGLAGVGTKATSWFLDSGASRHVVTSRTALVNIRRLAKPVSVTVADGKSIQSEYEGDAFIRTGNGVRKLENVLLYESKAINIGLISVGTLDRKGVQLLIGGGVAIARHNGDTIFRGKLVKNNMYHINAESIKPSGYDGDTVFLSAEAKLWHKRLAHVNIEALKHMHNKGMVRGLVSDHHNAEKCEACMKAKAIRRPFGEQMKRNDATVRFERVHADVIGPFRVPGFKGARYALIMVDEATDYVFYYLLKHKSDVAPNVKKWHALIKNQFNAVLKECHSDYGGEFVSKDLLEYWASHGVMATQTIRNTPQHNAVVERKNRTIKDGVRASLIQANLPPGYWAVALTAFVHVVNRSIRSVQRDITPYEAMHGIKPFVNHFRVFGCDAYVTVPNPNGGTIVRGEPMVFVGYDEQRGGWIFYWPSRNIHTVSRDAVFEENKFTVGRANSNVKSEDGVQYPTATIAPDWLLSDDNLFENEASDREGGGANELVVVTNNPVAPPVAPPVAAPVDPSATAVSAPAGIPVLDDEVIIVKRESDGNGPMEANLSPAVAGREEKVAVDNESSSLRSVNDRKENISSSDSVASRIRNKPAAATEFAPFYDQKYWNKRARQYEERKNAAASSGESVLVAVVDNEKEPLNHEEVLKSLHKEEWLAAEREELKSQIENKSFIKVPRSSVPSGHRVLQSRWVYKLKRDINNRIARYKARLVAKGYMQRYGIDYFETFAPVMAYRTLRVILSLAAILDLEIKQVDIVTAFLHADVKEDIYMELPDGYGKEGKVMKLKKAIYGIKQAPRAWNTLFNQVLIALGFKRLRSDACVYFDGFIIIGIFVDDVLILYASQHEDRWLAIKEQLFDRFKAKDLGDALFILGMRITRDRERRYLYLDQEAYLVRVVEKFKMSLSIPYRGCDTPMMPKSRPVTGDHLENTKNPYCSAIGSLMYASVSTRPDIAYAVNALAQFNNEPKVIHWEAVLRIAKYLSNTIDYKLRLGGNKISVAIYTDADWAGDKSDAKSVSGGVTCLGEGTVDWLSRKQKTVALSSMEAEFNAAVHAVQNALWIKQLLSELNQPVKGAVPVLEDNEATIDYCRNGGNSHRARHFNIKYKFVQDHVEKGNVELEWIDSKYQLADMLTKSLSVGPFGVFRDRLLSRVRS